MKNVFRVSCDGGDGVGRHLLVGIGGFKKVAVPVLASTVAVSSGVTTLK